MQSRKWLVEEYPQLIPQNAKEKKTSVIVKEFNQDEQYSNSLKEFLSPTFKNVPNNQQKKIGKQLKTYAQVLGMKQTSNDNNIKDKNQQKTNKVGKRKE